MPTVAKQQKRILPPSTFTMPRETRSRVVLSQLLPLKRLLLRVPLAITIEYLPRQVIVSNPDIELFGYGDTESEAIQGFAASFEELYFWLKKNKKKLSKNLKLKYGFLARIVSGG